MKRLTYLLIILLIITMGCNKTNDLSDDINQKKERIPLMNFGEYKNIDLDKVTSIIYSKFTEGGKEEEEITDKDEIQEVYYSLTEYSIGEEVTTACDDNTKIYLFKMDDGSTISIEIECDWLVVGNKRYSIE